MNAALRALPSPSANEVLYELARARRYFASADRHDALDRHDLAERARDRGWEVLRALLERHPWRPKIVRKKRRAP